MAAGSRPCLCIAGMISRSRSRASRLYSSWLVAKAVSLWLRRGGLRLVDLRSGEIGAADVTDLALADQVVKRTQGLLDRRFGVGEMHLVKIDPVCLEPLQARLGGFGDVAGRRAAGARLLHRQAELGRQHDVLAARAENAAEKLFRAALVAVGVSGVDQRDAEIERAVHHALRRLEIGAAAEIVAAEPDGGDF